MELTTSNNLPTGCVITLKEVVDTINSARVIAGSKSVLRHDKAMKTIEKLSETPSFGEVDNLSTFNLNKTEVKTLALTKKQAIAAAAKLDNTMLMQVIDRVEELENRTKELDTINNNTTNTLVRGLLEQGSQTQQLLSLLVQSSLKEPKSTKFEEDKIKLEIDILQIEKIEKVLALSSKVNLEELGSFETIPSELSSTMKKATGAIIKEVRPAVNGISPTACLKQSELNLKASELYRLLNQLGVCESYEYPHYTKGVVMKWKLTSAGRYYGYNQHSSSIKELPYQVKLYQDRFGELLDLLRNEGHID